MAITKSGDIITVKYESGDPKGNSYTNPYTLEDIYQADVSNGWGVVTKTDPVYYFNCGIKIDGSNTYFWDYNKVVVFTKTITTYFYYLQLTNAPNFRSGRHEKVDSSWYDWWMVWLQTGSSNISYAFFELKNAKVELYNSKFLNLRLTETNGTSTFYAKIYNCKIFNSATLSIGTYCEVEHLDCNATPFSNYLYLTIIATPVKLQYINLYFATFYCYGLVPAGCYAKNVNFFNNSDVLFYLNGGNDGRSLILCDSNAPKNISVKSYYLSPDTLWYYKLNSTFNFNIRNGDGATITLKDRDGNTVINQTLLGETYTQEVTYFAAKCWHIYDGQTGNAYKELYDYEPFSLKITKEGYQEFEIPSITITPGVPTEIRAKLTVLPLKISSLDFTHPTQSNNNGTITIAAEGGVSPYEYSIDDGETWQSSGEFTGLAAGDYIVKVKDNEGIEVDGVTVTLKKTDYIDLENLEFNLETNSLEFEIEPEPSLTFELY